jgi:hypothetical protein
MQKTLEISTVILFGESNDLVLILFAEPNDRGDFQRFLHHFFNRGVRIKSRIKK